jgi:hypothetical protein
MTIYMVASWFLCVYIEESWSLRMNLCVLFEWLDLQDQIMQKNYTYTYFSFSFSFWSLFFSKVE